MPGPSVKVRNLTVHYEGIPVLWDINLEIPQGVFLGVIGPNGAGKSTFIKTIVGLINPVSGSITLFGKRRERVKRRIAYVPQREAIDWDFPITAQELVLMGCYPKLGLFQKVTKKERQAAKEALKKVGLQDFADRQIGQLSGGQQQRLFLARALLQDADIYFLDEPLSGVDHASGEIIIDILRDMQRQGKTIFMVHHDLNNVESYFDWVLFLNTRLVAVGPTAEVFVPKYLQEAYGRDLMLYDQVVKISTKRMSGITS